MVEQNRNQVAELHFEKFQDSADFQCWKVNFCTQNTHSHDTFVHVQLITEGNAQVQSLTTRTRVAQGPTRLRIPHCGGSKKIPSAQRRVSHVAALVTEHFYTISFTCLTYLPTFFSRTVLWNWIKNTARLTAVWRIHQICISHRFRAQNGRLRAWKN